MKKLKFATRAIHAGQFSDQYGAVIPPIYQTTTFLQQEPGKPVANFDYCRAGSPTRNALEQNLAALEQAKHGICFASGCAALTAVLHLLKQGDHIIIGNDVYGGTLRIFAAVFAQFGVSYTSVDASNLADIEKAITTNTKLVWLETPTNPTLQIVDISKVSQLLANREILFAVDNTFASPYLQNPLLQGADIVCHSLTKYIGGHSDVLAGALLVNEQELAEKLYFVQKAVGAVPSAADCALLLRSTKTLAIRMQQHCLNAHKIANYLQEHNKVVKVLYPGLISHPGHKIALQQMHDFGGIVSIVIEGGLTKARQFLQNLTIFKLAESLGGVESLVDHPATMTHATVPEKQRTLLGITDGLIRLSVGIEDAEDLLDDLGRALSA